MRQFIVLGHDAPVEPDFALSDLAGGAGRLDVLCRCINSAFFLSHGLRENVRAHLVLQDELTVTFDGSELRRLNPDERSTAALIRKALERKEDAIGHISVETSPGVSLTRIGFETLLDEQIGDRTIVQLHEAGKPVSAIEPPAEPVFILSDHHDLEDHEAGILANRADLRVRLGPERLHADHAIVVAQNYLDTNGYTRV